MFPIKIPILPIFKCSDLDILLFFTMLHKYMFFLFLLSTYKHDNLLTNFSSVIVDRIKRSFTWKHELFDLQYLIGKVKFIHLTEKRRGIMMKYVWNTWGIHKNPYQHLKNRWILKSLENTPKAPKPELLPLKETKYFRMLETTNP